MLDTLRGQRLLWATEDELQHGLSDLLSRNGFHVAREVRLNHRDRIDLIVDARLGIEVKTSGHRRDVERQLHRYLASPLIDALILVTAKAKHRQIPQGIIEGKPLLVHQLEASGL